MKWLKKLKYFVENLVLDEEGSRTPEKVVTDIVRADKFRENPKRMMKGTESGGMGVLVGTRKPLQILSDMFFRKNRKEEDKEALNDMADKDFSSDEIEDECWPDSQGSYEIAPAKDSILSSPFHHQSIDKDIEALRLSRQDNPYLQVLQSRECLQDSEEENVMDECRQSKENFHGSGETDDDPLTLSEVHKRLVRSPPPVLWNKNVMSECALDCMDDSTIFRFPSVPGARSMMSPTVSCRSHHSELSMPATMKLLSPHDGQYLKFKEGSLDGVVGRFHLSPQARRRPPRFVRFFYSSASYSGGRPSKGQRDNSNSSLKGKQLSPDAPKMN